MLINSDFNITVTKITAANKLFNYVTDGVISRNRRVRWAVALKRSGTTYYTVGGKEVLSDAHHPVLLPKGCTYTWRCTEPGECLIIEFDANEEFEDIFSFSVADANFFISNFYDIERALVENTPEARLAAVYNLYSILLQLVKGASREYIGKEKRELLLPAVNHIAANYADQSLTNDTLASLCGISTVYFRKCFETVYGESPIRFLHNFRIQKAKGLLSSDYGSISQVAESVGYASLYHFSKMFKLYTGMNPTEYAKASRR